MLSVVMARPTRNRSANFQTDITVKDFTQVDSTVRVYNKFQCRIFPEYAGCTLMTWQRISKCNIKVFKKVEEHSFVDVPQNLRQTLQNGRTEFRKSGSIGRHRSGIGFRISANGRNVPVSSRENQPFLKASRRAGSASWQNHRNHLPLGMRQGHRILARVCRGAHACPHRTGRHQGGTDRGNFKFLGPGAHQRPPTRPCVSAVVRLAEGAAHGDLGRGGQENGSSLSSGRLAQQRLQRTQQEPGRGQA